MVEEKVAKNSEQIIKMSKIIDSQSELYETNYFDDLKVEMKKLKELLNSDLSKSQQKEFIVSPAYESNSDNKQYSTNFLQEENHKIKSNLISIKSEIKKIITKALSKDDEIIEKNPFDDLQIELAETSQKAQIDNLNETCLNDEENKINEQSKINIESQEKFNDLIEKIEQLKSENKSIKNDIDSIKSEIKKIIQLSNDKQQNQELESTSSSNDAQYKAMEATLTANEAQSKAIEANTNSFSAQCKADDAVFRANEAESKATFANEKADLIVSDNNKMNVDIRCIKYEVKKLRARVQKLEQSENTKNIVINDFTEQIDILKSKVKHLKNDFKKIKITEPNLIDSNASQFREENQNLRNEVKSLKSKIKQIVDNLNSSQVIAIPGDFIRQLNDAQNQSNHAYEKASKTHKEISEYYNKTNEIIDNIEKIKSDLHYLKIDVKKMKQSQNFYDVKTQKKDENKSNID